MTRRPAKNAALLQKDNCISPEGLVIVSEKAICRVDIESFFRQMNGLKAAEGLCCDFLFADGVRKIVFCDLTCSLRKYILPFRNSRGYQQGKRAKAYHQISSTIDKLMAVPNVAQYIHQMPLKIGLFAERDKDSATSDVAIKNMMLMMPDYSMENHLSTDMGNGFQFVTVHYPQAYQW